MKNSFLYVIACTGLLLTACNKALDTKPTDFSAPQYYYNSEADLNTALAGVYNTLTKNTVYGPGANPLWGYQDNTNDIGLYEGNRTTGVGVFQITASDPDVANLWLSLYQGIERANLLLANISKPSMDETKRSALKGEALFLRAYYYFLLVTHYGDVPLKLTPTTSANEVNMPRTPSAQVYAKILEDMKAADTLVYPITTFGHSGRVSKTAVEGVLARVCLTMAGEPLKDVAKLNDALSWAQKVINTSVHSLNPDFKQIFINLMQDKYDIKENVWEVEFKGNGTDGYAVYSGLGQYNGIQTTNIDFGFGSGNFGPTAKLFNLYQKDPANAANSLDLRRDWTIASFGLNNATPVPNVTYYTTTQVYERRTGKFRRADPGQPSYELNTPKAKNYTSCNFPVLRYSDVLLMAAEAENELNGPTTLAYSYINQVRERGYGVLLQGSANYGKPTVADLAPGLSQADFRQAIMDERARELAFEAVRRPDLIRWGILVDALKASAADMAINAPTSGSYRTNGPVAGNNITDYNTLYPIPLHEITLNKALTQNPGY